MIGCSGLAFIGVQGFHAKSPSSQRGTGARRVHYEIDERHGNGERGLRPRNDTEDHGNGAGVCGHGMTRMITEMGPEFAATE